MPTPHRKVSSPKSNSQSSCSNSVNNNLLMLKLQTVFNLIRQQKSQFSTYQILCVPLVSVHSSQTFSVLFHLSSINIQVKTDPVTGSPGVIYAFILSGTSRNPSLASNLHGGFSTVCTVIAPTFRQWLPVTASY